MDQISCIYVIKNIVNDKKYIGSTCDFARRKRQHSHELIHQKHSNDYLQKAWNKYGKKSFEWELIEYIPNINLLKEKEQYWMDKFKVCNDKYGYNIDPKADRKNLSEETKRKIGNANRTKLKGRKINKETCKIFAIAQKKRHRENPMSQETKDKISRNNARYWQGKTMSEAVRKKISENSARHWQGKKRSKEHRKKLSRAHKHFFKPVMQYTLDGIFIQKHESLSAVERNLGFNSKCVQVACKCRRPQMYGYKWKYEEDVNHAIAYT